MSEEARPIRKRWRGPSMTTLLTLAKRAGYRVAAAIVRGDGRVELKFADSGAAPSGNEWDAEYDPASP